MKRVERMQFEVWAETYEHDSSISVNSRIKDEEFVTEYRSSYSGELAAQVVSGKTGEIYYMA